MVITSATTDIYQVGAAPGRARTRGTTYSDEDAYVAGQVAIIALPFLGYLLGTVACYRAIADQYLGRPTGRGESLRYAAGRLGATLWLTIILRRRPRLRASSRSIIPGIWLGGRLVGGLPGDARRAHRRRRRAEAVVQAW